MARQRSPNYPSVDLATAVNLAKRLYEREGRTQVPQEAAVKAWGFNSLNGASRSRLSALKQYGLVNADRQGTVRLSPTALTLAVASPGSQKYNESLRTAALTPEIFHDLYEKMRDASDDSIRHELIVDRGFSADGANRLIEAYRETLASASLDDVTPDGIADDGEPSASELEPVSNASRHSLRWSPQGYQVSQSVQRSQYRWPLYGDVVAEVTFRGGEFTSEDVALLCDYLEIVKRTRARNSQQPTLFEDAAPHNGT